MTPNEQSEFLKQLEEALEADSDSLTMETVLADLPNWDSMSVLSFMAMMDSEYNVAVSPAKLAECSTVADLAAFRA